MGCRADLLGPMPTGSWRSATALPTIRPRINAAGIDSSNQLSNATNKVITCSFGISGLGL